jgi:hypothetical protein
MGGGQLRTAQKQLVGGIGERGEVARYREKFVNSDVHAHGDHVHKVIHCHEAARREHVLSQPQVPEHVVAFVRTINADEPRIGA